MPEAVKTLFFNTSSLNHQQLEKSYFNRLYLEM